MTAWDQAAVLWSPLTAGVGSLVIVVGCTLPGWGGVLSSRLEQWRSYRTLHPLWSALCGAAPGIALFEPRSPRLALYLRDLQTRLYAEPRGRVVDRARDVGMGDQAALLVVEGQWADSRQTGARPDDDDIELAAAR